MCCCKCLRSSTSASLSEAPSKFRSGLNTAMPLGYCTLWIFSEGSDNHQVNKTDHRHEALESVMFTVYDML